MAERTGDQHLLLTYQELGDRLGLAAEGARAKAKRKARAGEWSIVPGNDGRARVRLPAEALPVYPPGRPAERPGDRGEGARPADRPADRPGADELLTEVAGLRAVVGELRDAQAATARIRVEAVEARVDAARAMAERDAARSTAAAEIAAMRQQLETEVAARNAVIEELRTAMEHERAERAKLAAALAEARKPLLVRVVEAIRRKGS